MSNELEPESDVYRTYKTKEGLYGKFAYPFEIGCTEFMEENYQHIAAYPDFGENGEHHAPVFDLYEIRSKHYGKNILPTFVIVSGGHSSCESLVFWQMFDVLSFINDMMPIINYTKGQWEKDE